MENILDISGSMDDINQIISSYIEDNLIKNKDILTNHIYQKVRSKLVQKLTDKEAFTPDYQKSFLDDFYEFYCEPENFKTKKNRIKIKYQLTKYNLIKPDLTNHLDEGEYIVGLYGIFKLDSRTSGYNRSNICEFMKLITNKFNIITIQKSSPNSNHLSINKKINDILLNDLQIDFCNILFNKIQINNYLHNYDISYLNKLDLIADEIAQNELEINQKNEQLPNLRGENEKYQELFQQIQKLQSDNRNKQQDLVKEVNKFNKIQLIPNVNLEPLFNPILDHLDIMFKSYWTGMFLTPYAKKIQADNVELKRKVEESIKLNQQTEKTNKETEALYSRIEEHQSMEKKIRNLEEEKQKNNEVLEKIRKEKDLLEYQNKLNIELRDALKYLEDERVELDLRDTMLKKERMELDAEKIKLVHFRKKLQKEKEIQDNLMRKFLQEKQELLNYDIGESC